MARKYCSKDLGLKEVFHWVKQDREKLKLDVRKPIPEWAAEDHAKMDEWLLAC